MPYYPKLKILFIHIPKTGGTVIENEIKKITYQRLYSGKCNDLLPSPNNKISLQHQPYEILYKYRSICFRSLYIFNKIKMFTIVRNPYDRVISDLFFLKKIKKETSAEDVYIIIKNDYIFRKDLDNHNLPQYKFITDKNNEIVKNIKIFRTENLNRDNEILNKYLGININIIRDDANKDYSKYFCKESRKLIADHYRKDFELFNYDTFGF
mgnify:CR=1 FL=1